MRPLTISLRSVVLAMLACILCLSSCNGASTYKAATAAASQGFLHIGPSEVVTVNDPSRDYAEMIASADPLQADLLIACTMSFSGRTQGAPDTRVFSSQDGGTTWSLGVKDDLGDISDDPSCTSGLNGEAWFSATTGTFLRGRYQIAYQDFFKSLDGGKKWHLQLRVLSHPGNSAFVDRPYMNVDQTDSPHRGTTYYYGWGYLNTSEKRYAGASVFLSRIIRNRLHGPTLFADTSQYSGIAPMAGQGAVTTRGALLIPLVIFPNGAHGTPTRIGATLSLDGGRTLTQPVVISETKACDPGQEIPTAAVDTSQSPYSGRMYVAFTVPDDGETSASPRHCHVSVSHSDDGKTWSPPISIHEELARSLGQGTEASAAIAVNSRGIVAVSWLDTREDPSAEVMRPRVAVSSDGGESFSTSQAVSGRGEDYRLSQPFGFWANIDGGGFPQNKDYPTPQLPMLHAGFVPFVRFDGTPGDTRLMIADAAGRFHNFWFANTASVEHNTNLLTATIQADGRAYRNGDASLQDLKDITKALAINVLSTQFNRDEGRFAVQLSLINNSERTVRPMYARVLWMNSPYGPTSLLNEPVNGISTNGALLNLGSESWAHGIAPRGSSKPIKLLFKISTPPATAITESIVDFNVKVFGQ